VAIGLGFSSVEGKRLLTYDTDFSSGLRPNLPQPGVYSVDIELDTLPLAPEIYGLDIGCRSGDAHTLEYIAAGALVEVVQGPNTPSFLIRTGDASVRLASKATWQC
jgi:hypothetical protein